MLFEKLDIRDQKPDIRDQKPDIGTAKPDSNLYQVRRSVLKLVRSIPLTADDSSCNRSGC